MLCPVCPGWWSIRTILIPVRLVVTWLKKESEQTGKNQGSAVIVEEEINI